MFVSLGESILDSHFEHHDAVALVSQALCLQLMQELGCLGPRRDFELVLLCLRCMTLVAEAHADRLAQRGPFQYASFLVHLLDQTTEPELGSALLALLGVLSAIK